MSLATLIRISVFTGGLILICRSYQITGPDIED